MLEFKFVQFEIADPKFAETYLEGSVVQSSELKLLIVHEGEGVINVPLIPKIFVPNLIFSATKFASEILHL